MSGVGDASMAQSISEAIVKVHNNLAATQLKVTSVGPFGAVSIWLSFSWQPGTPPLRPFESVSDSSLPTPRLFSGWPRRSRARGNTARLYTHCGKLCRRTQSPSSAQFVGTARVFRCNSDCFSLSRGKLKRFGR